MFKSLSGINTKSLDVSVCLFRPSTKGSEWYQQEINGVWTDRPCSHGTIFSKKECQCIYYTDGFMAPKQGRDYLLTIYSHIEGQERKRSKCKETLRPFSLSPRDINYNYTFIKRE